MVYVAALLQRHSGGGVLMRLAVNGQKSGVKAAGSTVAVGGR